MVPNVDGYLYFRYDGWDVRHLRPSSDRYHAARKDKRIRWRF